MKNIILIAPPSAGKGTISSYLVNNYNYVHLSTGDLLRKEAKKDAKLNDDLKKGILIKDEIVEDLLFKALDNIKENQNFILDGYPRTISQAQTLEPKLQNYQVIYLDVDKEILKKRFIGRRICPKCNKTYNIYNDKFKPKINDICDNCQTNLIRREDDNEQTFQIRYQEFITNTYPLKKYYENKGLQVINNNEGNAYSQLLEVIK